MECASISAFGLESHPETGHEKQRGGNLRKSLQNEVAILVSARVIPAISSGDGDGPGKSYNRPTGRTVSP